MKYKLLKDINGAEAGTEFSLIPYPNMENSPERRCKHLIFLIGIDNKDYFEPIQEPKSIYDLKEDNKKLREELKEKKCILF